jgi:hypothetical protein
LSPFEDFQGKQIPAFEMSRRAMSISTLKAITANRVVRWTS